MSCIAFPYKIINLHHLNITLKLEICATGKVHTNSTWSSSSLERNIIVLVLCCVWKLKGRCVKYFDVIVKSEC
jgi:hypothetical protein